MALRREAADLSETASPAADQIDRFGLGLNVRANFADALGFLGTDLGDIAHFERSLVVLADALARDVRPMRGRLLAGRASGRDDMYNLTGIRAHLDDAISDGAESVGLLGREPDRLSAVARHNQARRLRTQYEDFGGPGLPAAIEMSAQAVHHGTREFVDWPDWAAGLADGYRLRAESGCGRRDRVLARWWATRAMRAAPDGSRRYWSGVAIWVAAASDDPCLPASGRNVLLQRAEAAALAGTDVDRPRRLANWAAALSGEYARTGDAKLARRTIQLWAHALLANPPTVADRVGILSSLGAVSRTSMTLRDGSTIFSERSLWPEKRSRSPRRQAFGRRCCH